MVTLSTGRVHVVYLALVFASPSVAHTAPPLALDVSAPAPQDARAAGAQAESHLQTGWDQMKSGDFEAASVAFRRALELMPDLAAAHFFRRKFP